jgi:glycosyltransferase 2 family protein
MKYISVIVKCAVSLGLIAYLVHMVDLRQCLRVLHESNYCFLGLAFLTYLSTFIIITYRWQSLLAGHNLPVPFRKLFIFYLIGFFFNNFLPTSIGGDLVRIYKTAAFTSRTAVCFSAVFMERLIGSLAIVFLGVAGLFVTYNRLQNPALVWCAVTILAGLVVIIFLVTRQRGLDLVEWLWGRWPWAKFKEKGNKLIATFRLYQGHPGVLYKVLALSFLYQLVMVFFAFLVNVAIHLGASLQDFIVCIPVVATLGMLPSLNGLGVRESGFVYLLTHLGRSNGPAITSAEAFSFSVLILLTGLLVSLIGGVVFVFEKQSRPKSPSFKQE